MKSEETVSVGQKTKQNKKKPQRWQGNCRQGKPTIFIKGKCIALKYETSSVSSLKELKISLRGENDRTEKKGRALEGFKQKSGRDVT